MTNYKLFNKKNLSVRATEVPELDSVKMDTSKDILDKSYVAYNNLAVFRKYRQRCSDYNFGKQWEDVIWDASKRRYIKEKDYIKSNGKMPLTNNVIRKYTKSIIGMFRNNKTEPLVVTRDRDEQKIGEMASVVMQYNYQVNNMTDVDARALEELCISGIAVQATHYQFVKERNSYEAITENIPIPKFFCNSDFTDANGSNLRLIGYLHDMSIKDILRDFAHSREEAETIRECYSHIDSRYDDYVRTAFSDESYKDESFYVPHDRNLCRVIEVWTLESKERYRVHDELNGKIYIAELKDKDAIDRENASRIVEATKQGVEAEDVPLMQYEWFVDNYWYVRFITPDGHVLHEEETPYTHESTPFTICIHSIFDGKIHSFVGDLIDPQRFINRYITMLDFMRGASAKGVLVFPEEMLGEMSKQEVLQEWTKFNGVIFAKTKPGVPMPQQINSSVVTAGDMEMLQMHMKFLDEISGVHSAMLGDSPKSGTPSSLYAQQAQNSAVNVIDLIDTFTAFRQRRDMKILKTIQQYYDTPRYINIAGKMYSEESKHFSPDKIRDAEFDVSITEGASTPAVRMAMDEYLMQMFQMGAVDAQTLLENSSLPFADNLLEGIKRRKEQMQQEQMQQQAQQGVMMPQGAEEQQQPVQMPQRKGELSQPFTSGENGKKVAQQLINQALS